LGGLSTLFGNSGDISAEELAEYDRGAEFVNYVKNKGALFSFMIWMEIKSKTGKTMNMASNRG
jgi:hypothetical protein